MPWVVGAALRVAFLYSKMPLDEAVKHLRRIHVRFPGPLRNPMWLRGLVDRLLPVLPPAGGGRCLKRSLMLLDLWSRCALEPRFFIGVKPGFSRPEGHAWLEAEGLPPTESDRSYTTVLEL